MAQRTIWPLCIAPCGFVLLLIIAFIHWVDSTLRHFCFCYYTLLLIISIVELTLSAAFFHSNFIILLRTWCWRVICNLIWLRNYDTASFSVLRWTDGARVVWFTAQRFVLTLIRWLTRKDGMLRGGGMAKALLPLMFELAMIIVQIWLKFI